MTRPNSRLAWRTATCPRIRPTLLACALATIGLPAAAETATPVVVITGVDSTLPDSDRIGAAERSRLNAASSDTASLLRNVPGVSLYGAGGVSSLPAIHGLADDRLRIKVDGMDLIASCPNHMNPALSYVDPGNVGTLIVYPALSPVSLGGDSLGGTIVLDTVPPPFATDGARDVGGRVAASYRDNGGGWSASMAAHMATANFSLAYAFAHAESGNQTAGGDFHAATATGREGHTLAHDEIGSTAFESENHTLALAWRGEGHLIEARLGVQDMPFQLYPNQRMDMLDNQQQRIALHYVGDMAWGALDARIYHEHVDHLMDFGADKRFWYGAASGGPMASFGSPCAPVSATCATGMPMRTEGKTDGVALKATIHLDDGNRLRLGADVQHYRLDDWWPPSGAGMWPGTFWNINNGQRDRTALYAEWEGRIAPGWRALAGWRGERVTSDAGDVRGYDPNTNGMGTMINNQKADAAAFNARSHERTDNNNDLTILVRHTPDATRDVEFGIARKTRSPNLYERYTWSTWSMAAVMNNFVGDGNGYIGNLDLQPEVAHSVSGAMAWHAADKSWALRIAPYATWVKDFIDARRCVSGASCTSANATTTNQFVVLQYVNQDARLLGLDVSGHMPLPSNAWGQWRLDGTLSYVDGKNRDTDDGLYHMMPLQLQLGVQQAIGAWQNRLELVSVAAKTEVSQVRNEIATGGYALAHLRVAYVMPRWRVDAGVENLFDRAYALPLGGAYVAQGTTMMANAVPWGIAVPGAGRTVYAGVSMQF